MKKILLYLLLTGLLPVSCSYESPIVEWEDGIIPYYFTGNFSDNEVLLIKEGMGRWEGVCGVRFMEVTPRAYAYEIRKIMGSQSWMSSIGENNIDCFFNYGVSENPMIHIVHELGHCIGLLHEHQRPDRDSYVTIRWENIYPEYEFDFEIRDNPLITEELYPYDYSSVMHYPRGAFSINGYYTIIPLDPDAVIGNTDIISTIDAEKAREIYGPPLDDDNF